VTDVACSLAVPVNRLEADGRFVPDTASMLLVSSVDAAGHAADTLTESDADSHHHSSRFMPCTGILHERNDFAFLVS
jgi:hypothetical protein